MKIAVVDDYAGVVDGLACFSKLRGHEVEIVRAPLRVDALPQAVRDAQALVTLRERTRIDRDLLDRLPHLELISQTGPIPHIDLAACSERGVLVSSSPPSSPAGGSPASRATAELCWGLVLATARRIPQEAAALKAGRWQTLKLGAQLHGRTLGLLGYGRVGSLVAGYGRAFGMRVLVWGREGSRARALADGFEASASRLRLFRESDVLSLHIALSSETRGSITYEELAAMKPTAILVNTARAGLIAPGALMAALQAGRPGFAASDVFDDEPVRDAADPLLALPNFLGTPHLGYAERDALEDFYARAFDQVLAYAAGHPVEVCNPEALR